MYDTFLIVDQYQRHKEAIRRGLKLDVEREAQTLSMLVKPLGLHDRRIAVIAEDDPQGLTAYQKSGFEIVPMNGDRPHEIRQFMKKVTQDVKVDQPEHLVLVTTDAAFEILCDRVSQHGHTKLSVWAPSASVPAELIEYNYRKLEDLLPETKVLRCDARLDYENLHIGLERRGARVDPATLINAVKAAIADLGDVANIVAYADWSLLAKNTGRDIQRELAKIQGVESRYQVNMRGKNSADMKIADDIRTLVERDTYAPDAVDIIVLGTNDRDFRPIVETARLRGKKVIVVALRDGLSNELRQAANEVRFLDDHLPSLQQEQRQTAPRISAHEHADLAMRIEVWLRRQNWKWVYADRLVAAFTPDQASADRLRKVVEANVLTQSWRAVKYPDGHEGKAKTYALNEAHPLVQTLQHLATWAPARVAYCLHERGMPYVDTNFLSQGMAMDPIFRRLGVARTRTDAEEWLNLVVAAGLLQTKAEPHPKDAARTITTWRLLEQDVSAQTPDKASDTERLRKEENDPPAPNRVQAEQLAEDVDTVRRIPLDELSDVRPELARSNFRRILMEGLSDDEIDSVAFDIFPEVHRKFAVGMAKSQKVQIMLEHVMRRGLVLKLLAAVRAVNEACLRPPEALEIAA
jgi:hypothetical protein